MNSKNYNSKYKQTYGEFLTIISSVGISNKEFRECLGVSSQTVSYFINKARRSGVVIKNIHHGVEVYYSVQNIHKLAEITYDDAYKTDTTDPIDSDRRTGGFRVLLPERLSPRDILACGGGPNYDRNVLKT